MCIYCFNIDVQMNKEGTTDNSSVCPNTCNTIEMFVPAVYHLFISCRKEIGLHVFTHHHTSAFTSSHQKCFPFTCFFSGLKRWKLLGTSSGLYADSFLHVPQCCAVAVCIHCCPVHPQMPSPPHT